MRILKGYSKAEKKELKALKKLLDINDLLNIITGNLVDRGFNPIWEKYNEAEPDEQVSIIRDILDFYTDKAKFPEPKKYYVHFVKDDKYSYLNINSFGVADLSNSLEIGSCKTKLTRDEVVAIDPRYVSFMEEVEE